MPRELMILLSIVFAALVGCLWLAGSPAWLLIAMCVPPAGPLVLLWMSRRGVFRRSSPPPPSLQHRPFLWRLRSSPWSLLMVAPIVLGMAGILAYALVFFWSFIALMSPSDWETPGIRGTVLLAVPLSLVAIWGELILARVLLFTGILLLALPVLIRLPLIKWSAVHEIGAILRDDGASTAEISLAVACLHPWQKQAVPDLETSLRRLLTHADTQVQVLAFSGLGRLHLPPSDEPRLLLGAHASVGAVPR